MAVKLARSKEGQIREDVETELRLLYALSAQSTAGVGVSGGRKSSNASSAAGTGDEKGAGEMDGGEVFFDAAGAAAAADDDYDDDADADGASSRQQVDAPVQRRLRASRL